jgi:hypothetical protein
MLLPPELEADPNCRYRADCAHEGAAHWVDLGRKLALARFELRVPA